MLQRVQNAYKKYFVAFNYIIIKQHYLFNYFWIFNVFFNFISTEGLLSVEQCCVREKIPNICVRTLCNPGSPPSDFAVYDVFDRRNNCSKHLNQIAKCLAAGRDHSPCCSKEAKDLDENVCFGLCRGEGNYHRASAYQTCIALNLASMFSCFEKGYQKIPSFPRNLVIGQIGTNEVEFSWQEPEHNSKFVDHYLIYIYELETGKEEADLTTELQIETMAREAKITQLEPGTRYLLQIIALGITNSNLELSRSLPSELRFKTCGIAPQAKPFKEKIFASIGSNALIACRIRTSGISTKNSLIIKWEHKKHEIHRQGGGHFYSVELNEERITQSHYVFSKFRPRELLAMLQIKRTKSEDYGLYKCRVSDDFGETEAIVHLSIATVQSPLPSPPEMPRQCCSRRGVSKRCLIMCGMSDSETRRYVPRPFMSLNCSGEIAKVLACAMPLVDESPCCMTKEIPSECLYLCDHQQRAPNLMPSHCLQFVTTAEECRLSGIHNRPSVVRNLKAQINTENIGTISINLNYDNSERADIYYIYWRSEGGNWQYKTSIGTNKKLITNSKIDELVVVAANSFGFSQPSQLFLKEGKWVKNYKK